MIILALGITSGAHAQTKVYTLEECQQTALDSNAKLRQAHNSELMSEQTKKSAFTNYFPTVSGMGVAFDANQGMANVNLMGQEMYMLKKGCVASVTAVQPIFAGGQILNGNKLAKVGVEVSRLSTRLSEKEVTHAVQQYYWQIITLKGKRQSALSIAEMLDTVHHDVKVSLDAGLVYNNDLLQVELRQNEIRSALITIDNGISLCRQLLSQTMGLGVQDIDVADLPLSVPTSPLTADSDEHPLWAQSVVGLPEYSLLQKQVEASELQRRMAIGKHLPTVAVGVGAMHNGFDVGTSNYGIMFATVSVPISSWWGGSHDVKKQKLAVLNAQSALQDNTEMLTIRMQKAWNDMNDARKQHAIALESKAQASENLRINANRYHAGTITMNDLLQAQSLYQQCTDKCIEQYADYQLKQFEYQQAVDY